MPAPVSGPTSKLGPWTGMNNRLPAHSLPEDKLRNAVNVVFDDTGRARTRPGVQRRYSGVGCHSFYACPLGRFFVENGVLSRHVGDDIAIPLRNVAGPVAYHYAYDGYLYCSDNATCWKVSPLLAISVWGDPIPSTAADFETAGYTEYPEVFGAIPPGVMIRGLAGRLFIISGATAHFTDAYATGRYRPHRNYIPFESTIRVFEPVEDGVWVATENLTWWLQGTDPSHFAEQMQIFTPKLPYGGVFGSGTRDVQGNRALWMSLRGAIAAGSGGQIANLQEAHTAVSTASSGASLLLEHDGMRHLISTLAPTVASPFANAEWKTNESTRRA